MTLDLQNITFLVVEDIPFMRELTVSMLAALQPCNILDAANGQKAVDIFYRRAPDIVITDWDMEPVDGIHLTRLIRNDPLSPNRKTPVILTTSLSDNDHLSIARDAGVTEYLIKPFSAKDLAVRLDSIINHPREFVETVTFFGPDRRRHLTGNYKGLRRREADNEAPAAKSGAQTVPTQIEFVDQKRDLNFEKIRVLIVEDNPAICLVTKTILRNAGITQVFVCYDGRRALQFLDAAPEMVDLIICDWEMPHVTGIELLRQVRATYNDMPFIMLTGRADLPSVKTALDSGVDAYIVKPVSLNDIRANIAKALQRRKRRASSS